MACGRKRGFAQLKTVTEEASMEWTIDNFLDWSKSKEKGSAECSPIFRFFFPSVAKTFSFSFNIYPNGQKEKEGDDISVFLSNKNELDVTLKMTLQILDKQKEAHRKQESESKILSGYCRGWNPFMSRKWLQDNMSEVLPEGALTIRCDLKIPVSENSIVSYDEARPAKCLKENASFFADLMTDKDFIDFKIVCQGQTFDCHKSILAARSPVFRAMLNTTKSKEVKSRSLIIKDFEKSSVSQMLKFCYTGCLDEDDVSRLTKILLLADKYDIKVLVETCESSLATVLRIDTCLEVLEVAHKISSAYLLQTSARFVAKNFAEIKGTSKWAKLTKSSPLLLAAVLDEMSELSKEPSKENA